MSAADAGSREEGQSSPQGTVGSLRARMRGALLGVVIGDALGAAFEGHPGPVPVRLLATMLSGRSPLRYTDDTAMTFALAESLLFCNGLDPDHLAATFAVTYERDPDRGYGAGAAALLSRIAHGADWRTAAASQFGGQGSLGNGAAMRVAPVALHAMGAQATVVDLARASALVTHTHPEAVDAAGLQAAVVAHALTQHTPLAGGLARLREAAQSTALGPALAAIAALPPESSPADVAAVTGTGVAAVEAVPAAVAAAELNLGSFPDTIRFAISMGGDTDTIAAMAGAISGARLGEGAIPTDWLQRVEGADRARDIADRFATRVRQQQDNAEP